MCSIINAFVATIIYVVIICFIFCNPFYSEKKDNYYQKFHVEKKRKSDFKYSTVELINWVIIVPIIFIISFNSDLFAYRSFFSDSDFTTLINAIATLCLSSFSIILLVDALKVKDNLDGMNDYLLEEGYFKYIKNCKNLMMFLLICFIFSNIPIALIDDIRFVNCLRVIIVSLFVVYLFFFNKCVKMILKFREYYENKYLNVLKYLYNNYLNRPYKTFLLTTEEDLKKYEKILASEVFTHLKSLKKYDEIEYIKENEYIEKFKPNKFIFIKNVLLLPVTFYVIYFCFFSFFLYNIKPFDLLIYLIISFLLVLLIFAILIYMINAYLATDVQKKNAHEKSNPLENDKEEKHKRLKYEKFYEKIVMTLLARNHDYNRFLISKKEKQHLEENLCWFKDSHSKKAVLLLASVRNSLDQIFGPENESKFNFITIISSHIFDLIMVYYNEVSKNENDMKLSKEALVFIYAFANMVQQYLEDNEESLGKYIDMYKIEEIKAKYTGLISKIKSEWENNPNLLKIAESINKSLKKFIEKKEH